MWFKWEGFWFNIYLVGDVLRQVVQRGVECKVFRFKKHNVQRTVSFLTFYIYLIHPLQAVVFAFIYSNGFKWVNTYHAW